MNKYQYFRVIQQNYGQGWEDVSHYPTKSDFVSLEKSGKTKVDKYGRTIEISLLIHDLKEYQTLGYPTRVINRKELAAN